MEVEAIVNAVTTREVPKGDGLGSDMVTEALLLVETLPAASLAQAYRVCIPDRVVLGNVKFVGAVALHPAADARGATADWVTM